MKANIDFFGQLRKEIEAQKAAFSEEVVVDTRAKENDAVSDGATDAIKRLKEENRRLKEEVKQLKEKIDDYNPTPDGAEPLMMTETDIAWMDDKVEEEMRKEAALQQVEELMAQVKSLQEELRHRDDGVQRLPLAVFIEYAEENYTHDQNEYARILKEVLQDVFSSFTDEERARLKKLGHKPQPKPNIDKIFEITKNKNVNVGMR